MWPDTDIENCVLYLAVSTSLWSSSTGAQCYVYGCHNLMGPQSFRWFIMWCLHQCSFILWYAPHWSFTTMDSAWKNFWWEGTMCLSPATLPSALQVALWTSFLWGAQLLQTAKSGTKYGPSPIPCVWEAPCWSSRQSLDHWYCPSFQTRSPLPAAEGSPVSGCSSWYFQILTVLWSRCLFN